MFAIYEKKLLLQTGKNIFSHFNPHEKKSSSWPEWMLNLIYFLSVACSLPRWWCLNGCVQKSSWKLTFPFDVFDKCCCGQGQANWTSNFVDYNSTEIDSHQLHFTTNRYIKNRKKSFWSETLRDCLQATLGWFLGSCRFEGDRIFFIVFRTFLLRKLCAVSLLLQRHANVAEQIKY